MSVFANGNEVSGKAQPNKIIAGFPSVCLSPPSPPAGPIPIPYPMFTDAKKTTQGTRSVKVKKKEAGKKNSSLYKKSKGNEPATRSFGMDVVSHTLSGKTKHQAYSFNVKFEGKGANRFLDLTTTNHMNPATAVTIDAAKLDVAMLEDPENPCAELTKKAKDERDRLKTSDQENLTEKQNAKLQSTGKGKTTITAYQYTAPPGGSSSSGKACSRKVVGDLEKDQWATGIGSTDDNKALRKDKKEIPSGVCDKSYKYPHAYRPLTSHTESRILEDLASSGQSGGRLVMSVNWSTTQKTKHPVTGKVSKKPATSHKPCPHCKNLICKATECFEIYMCDEENNPVDMKEECKKPNWTA